MTRKRLVRLGVVVPIVLSAVFVYWVAQGVENPRELLRAAGSASWPFLLAIVPVNLLSHFLRATRWRRFIGQEVSTFYAFSSVMIGYAVNGVLPRGGEVARLLNMSRATGLPMAMLLATLVAERLVDLCILVLLLGLAVLLAGNRVGLIFPELRHVAPVAMGGAVVGLAVLCLLSWKAESAAAWIRRVLEPRNPRLSEWLGRFLSQLGDGLAIVRRPSAMALALGETVAMWALYIVAFGLGLEAFGLWHELGLAGATVSYAITSASALVPSAGQIGTFHALGTDALSSLYGVARDTALACVTVLHLLLFYGIAGIGGVLLWLAQEFTLGAASRGARKKENEE